MRPSVRYLSPSEAARRLGVSAKALRLYEQRGLVSPLRTGAGWRAYGPDEMARASEVVALRGLGLSLAQVARVLKGDPGALEPALALHQSRLEAGLRDLAAVLGRVRALRRGLAAGQVPGLADLAGLAAPAAGPSVAFDLPWPWGGERFEFRDVPALTYIIGPLGSGKTRLAEQIALSLPGAVFIGLHRDLGDAKARLEADAGLRVRVDRALGWLAEEGAAPSDALTVLTVHLEDEGPAALVFDLIEQGLDEPAQQALAAWLKHRADRTRPVVLMTRSSAILDLAAVGPDEAILLCPANHCPPTRVAPWPGAPGYEAVETCLASPDVRARTEGVIAWRPDAA